MHLLSTGCFVLDWTWQHYTIPHTSFQSSGCLGGSKAKVACGVLGSHMLHITPKTLSSSFRGIGPRTLLLGLKIGYEIGKSKVTMTSPK